MRLELRSIPALLVFVAACHHIRPTPLRTLVGAWEVEFAVEANKTDLPPRFVGRLQLATSRTSDTSFTGTHEFEDGRFLVCLDSIERRDLRVPPNFERRVEARMGTTDSVFVEINPSMDHGRLRLRGSWQGSAIRGQWIMPGYFTLATGTFSMRPAKSRKVPGGAGITRSCS